MMYGVKWGIISQKVIAFENWKIFIQRILHHTLYIILHTSYSAYSQDTISIHRPNYKALHWFMAGEAVAYTGIVYGLSSAWYQTNNTSNFRVIDDSHEWLQIDKVGHFYTSYQICRASAALYRQTGVTPKQAAIYGAISGFMFLTPIEILDGFQSDYGFSQSDMVANVLGPATFLGQYALWGEARIQPKWSFHNTTLAAARPELLGRNNTERWLKDYNGQTYWLSANLHSFWPQSNIPRWLNVAVGYGIQDMVSAEVSKSQTLGYDSYRQYYLSLDVDFTKIKTKKRWLKTIFMLVNTLKIPAPALEFNRNGMKIHGLYF
jgi:uncharacterized protein YfiM (DUF2279 family)